MKKLIALMLALGLMSAVAMATDTATAETGKMEAGKTEAGKVEATKTETTTETHGHKKGKMGSEKKTRTTHTSKKRTDAPADAAPAADAAPSTH